MSSEKEERPVPPGKGLDLDRFVNRLVLWKRPDDVVTLKNPTRQLPLTAVVCANGRADLLAKLIKAGATHSLTEAFRYALRYDAQECVAVLEGAGVKPPQIV
ncbi:MAG: hypothetical protein QM758_04685 [Armatimonas sp.]